MCTQSAIVRDYLQVKIWHGGHPLLAVTKDREESGSPAGDQFQYLRSALRTDIESPVIIYWFN